jgi:uncharacterized membrane protein (UPF0127 family)
MPTPPAASTLDLPGWTIRRALGSRARLQGLLGRRSLPPDEGLWLSSRSVHTLGMRMALDLVWLDACGAPVRTDVDVRAGRLRACLRARGGVIEVAAGRGGDLAAALERAVPAPDYWSSSS